MNYLFLLIILFPIVEIITLIKIGSQIGALNTIVLLILIGTLGSLSARMQGIAVLNKIQNNLNLGQMPDKQLLDGAMILAGGILLVVPGFISDILGLLLLIPLTRTLIKAVIQTQMKSMINKGETIHIARFRNPGQKYDDIDIN